MKKRNGFTLLEVLIALVFLSIVIMTFLPILGWLISRSRASAYGTEASLVLQEGMEATYNILLADWDTNWTRYPEGIYHLAVNVTANPQTWALLPGSESGVETHFTRQIEILPVCREQGNGGRLPGNCPIGAATRDNNSKVIRTTVSWPEQGRTKSVESELLVTYLGN